MRQVAQITLPDIVWKSIPDDDQEMLRIYLYAINKTRTKKLDDFIQDKAPFLKNIPTIYLDKIMKRCIRLDVQQSQFGEIYTIFVFGKRKGVLRMKNISIEVEFDNGDGSLIFKTK